MSIINSIIAVFFASLLSGIVVGLLLHEPYSADEHDQRLGKYAGFTLPHDDQRTH